MCTRTARCAAAKAGVHFVACEGELHFSPGDTWRSIEVTLLPSEAWTPALEFNIHLAQLATLGPRRRQSSTTSLYEA